MPNLSEYQNDLERAMTTAIYRPQADVLAIATHVPRLTTNAKIAANYVETQRIYQANDAGAQDRWQIMPDHNPANNVFCSTTEDYCSCRQHHVAPIVANDPRGRFCPYRMAAMMKVKEAALVSQRLIEAIEFTKATLAPQLRVVLFIDRTYMKGQDLKQWYGIGTDRHYYIPVSPIEITNAAIANAAAVTGLSLTTPEGKGNGSHTYFYDLRIGVPPEPSSILTAHTATFISAGVERRAHTQMLNDKLEHHLRTFDQGDLHAAA